MAFGRIGEFISRLSPISSQTQLPLSLSSSSSASGSASLPPKPRTHDASESASTASLSSAAKMSNIRLSSSLQDLASYRHRDDEDAHILPIPNKAPSHFPHSPRPKEKPLPSNKCLRSLFLFICLLLFAFLLYLFVLSLWYPKANKFFVVLDSGSTGTRAYVYQASPSPHSLPILITQPPRKSPSPLSSRAYNRVETEPAFHKLVHNVSGLKGAIEPLMSWAEKQIPKSAHRTTSVFLYATAGVRRLARADSDWILDNAWSILQSTSPFSCRREWVKIISGTEEAYFGWIALNHRRGVLGANPRTPTFGALDMGGSSLQVTFESDRHVATNLNLRIGRVSHHLTAYSLSGYGLNDAFDKSVASLFKRLPLKDTLKPDKLTIKHPCLQSGYREKYTCSHCEKSRIAVSLIGDPNWDECSALAKITVNISEWSETTPGMDCETQPCALSPGVPRPYGQFYALSGFYVVYKFFNLTSEATLDDVLEKGRDFCERSWDVAKSSVVPQPFIEQYCFRAPYIALLLREGLQIKENQIVIDSGTTTWTLGVALLEAGNAFSSRMGFFGNYKIFQMKIKPLVLLLLLFVSLILLVCALSYVGNWRPKFLRRSYLPLFGHNGMSSASVLNISSPFRFQRWSRPISSGDGRAKMPLSPTINGTQDRSFAFGYSHGAEIQLMESSTSGVAHSYSSNNLGQMQFDGGNSAGASFWGPHRGQMRLQSRRSQSREDLSSSLAEV